MDGNILNSDNEFFLYEYVKKALERDTSLEIHPAVSLIELVDTQLITLTADEIAFIKRASRVDFAVTKGYGKRRVIFVFESDSTSHDTATQKKRDKMKDNILRKSGIYVLRFRNIHYQSNNYGERFIDAVLSNIRNQEYIKALGMQAWEDAQAVMTKNHPLFVVLPYEKEYQELILLTERLAGEWELSEDWCQEQHGTSWNRQSLFRWENKRGKLKSSATGRCSDKEFVYGSDYVAERIAQMACLYKHLVNKKLLKSQRRPFWYFLDEKKNYDANYDCYREYEVIEEDV